MDQRQYETLMAEYKVNVDLWKHDDDIRAKRATSFLAFNAVLFGVLSFALKEPSFGGSFGVLVAVLSASIAVPMCLVWLRMQARNAAYLKIKRLRLAEIEATLGMDGTFAKQHTALVEHKEVQFSLGSNGLVSYLVPRSARASSAMAESVLPWCLAAMWVAAALILLVR